MGKTDDSPFKIRMFILTTYSQHYIVSSQCNKEEKKKEIKDICIGKENKNSLFTDDMVSM